MVAAVACGLLGPGAATTLGATSATPYDFLRFNAVDSQTSGRFGDRMKSAGDLNRDGVGDLWIGVYDRDIGTLQNVGRVYALSGKDRRVLYSIDSPEPQSCTGPFCGFGWSVSNLGDVDRDGVNDLVVGSVRHNVTPPAGAPCAPGPGCNVQQGRAWVYSGAPGKQDRPLYKLDNPAPQAFGAFGWGSTAGDIAAADGSPGKDGISEILVGAFQNDFPAGCGGPPTVPAPNNCRKDQGQAFIFNGANGQLLPGPRGTLDVPPEDRYVDPATGTCDSPPPPGQTLPVRPTSQRCGALGIVNEGVGDVNRDGFWDQSVTAWTTGVNPTTGEACLGVSPPVADACNERQGRIYLYSGRDGSLLRKIDDPVPQEQALFGLQIVEAGAPGDVNRDGFADVYGNGFQQHGPTGRDSEGQSWVFSGRTISAGAGPTAAPLRTPLYRLTDPTPEVGGQFGYSLAKTDYNKDGAPDLYVGSSPHHEPGTRQLGGTYVFNGPNGRLLKILDLPPRDAVGQAGTPTNLGPQLGRSVAAPGDLNGDREPDYVAGAPTYDVLRQDDGRLYFFLSRARGASPSPGPQPTTKCPPGNSPGVTCQARPGGGLLITGTAGNDTIVGSTGNDLIRCGDGDDVVSGGPGDDTIYCGDGRDRVSGNAGNDRLFGEADNDRLFGNSGTDSISGGTGNDRADAGSGRDRLNGNRGDDILHGNSGNDSISGSFGRDRISGNSGNDRLSGNADRDRISGDSGRDRIKGGSGRDRLSGASGNDSINARDRQRDIVSCGRGRDRVSADRRRGRDRVSRSCERVRRR